MIKKILVEPAVESIVMPENLKIGIMVDWQRKTCSLNGCNQHFFSLAFGQSPFFVPDPMVSAMGEQAHHGHYSPAEGILELREAVAGFNQRHFNLDVDPSRIIIGPGTKHLIDIVFNVLRGDVILLSPSWIGYYPQVKLLEKHYHTIYLKPENKYKLQPEDLDKFLMKLHKEQHILVLNNPHNPTGTVYSKSELESLTEVCRKHNTMVLADEIYALCTYNMDDFNSMGTVYPEGSFITNGLSKDRSAGGYRLGSCILPESCSEQLIEDFKKVAATVYTNVSTPTQYAAIAAYDPDPEIEEYFNITRQVHRIMGKYMSGEFNRIEGIQATDPEGGFYFFADFNELTPYLRERGVSSSNELAPSLLSHPHHIAIVTGDACMLMPDNYGGRIAFVDYDGRAAFDAFKNNPPENPEEERKFVSRTAPLMIEAIDALKAYVEFIKK